MKIYEVKNGSLIDLKFNKIVTTASRIKMIIKEHDCVNLYVFLNKYEGKIIGASLRTYTIRDKDQPIYSYMIGHHDLKTFTKAHANEGWDADDVTGDEYLVYKHAEFHFNKVFFKEEPTDKSFPVTVMEW